LLLARRFLSPGTPVLTGATRCNIPDDGVLQPNYLVFELVDNCSLIDASKEVGLEVNVERTKYILVSRDQNAGQNREIKIGNR
jgi:hypothetical protein